MVRISKLRNVLVVLAAGACVAVAMGSVIPNAQARPNDGRYQKSAEAKRKQRQCAGLHDAFKVETSAFDEAHLKGDEAAAGKALDDAYATFNTAKKAGCSWASREAPPAPPLPHQTSPPPVGAAST